MHWLFCVSVCVLHVWSKGGAAARCCEAAHLVVFTLYERGLTVHIRLACLGIMSVKCDHSMVCACFSTGCRASVLCTACRVRQWL